MNAPRGVPFGTRFRLRLLVLVEPGSSRQRPLPLTAFTDWARYRRRIGGSSIGKDEKNRASHHHRKREKTEEDSRACRVAARFASLCSFRSASSFVVGIYGLRQPLLLSLPLLMRLALVRTVASPLHRRPHRATAVFPVLVDYSARPLPVGLAHCTGSRLASRTRTMNAQFGTPKAWWSRRAQPVPAP